jgi:hypothetical protein
MTKERIRKEIKYKEGKTKRRIDSNANRKLGE